MASEQEVRDLANKLLQTGVSRSHLDAMKMAESMLGVDLTPSGRKIDNLDAPNVTAHKLNPALRDPSIPEPVPINVDANIDVTKNLNEIDMQEESEPVVKEEVFEELKEIEIEPNHDDLTIHNETESLSEAQVEEEILEIEDEADSTPVYQEQEMEQELEEPQIVQVEQNYDNQESLSEVETEIQQVEQMPDSTPVYQEQEMEQELNTPEFIQAETSLDNQESLEEVEQEIARTESKPDSFGEQQLERELNPGEVRTNTGITATTTDLEEYALRKMQEQGAMNVPVESTMEEQPVMENSSVSSSEDGASEPILEEPKETFILSNMSDDSEDDSDDSDEDITNLF